MRTSWISLRKADFGKLLFIGMGIGADPKDLTFCLMFVLGHNVLTVGPHLQPRSGTTAMLDGGAQ